MREPHLLAGCFAAGFLLTAAISLWKSRDPAEAPVRTYPAARAAAFAASRLPAALPPRVATVPVSPAPEGSRADARPLAGDLPETLPQDMPPESAERLEPAARRSIRRAAERGGH